MSPARPTLRLHPEECDGCGRCIAACRAAAIRVGPGFIFVAWERCDGCGKCVAYCDRSAIEPRDAARVRSSAASAGGGPGSVDPGWGGLRADELAEDGILVVGDPAESGTGGVSRTAASAAATAAASEPWDAVDAWLVVVASVFLVIAMQLGLASDAVRSLQASGLVLTRSALLAAYYLLLLGLLEGLAVLRHRVPLTHAFALRRLPPPAAWPVTLGLAVVTWSFARLYQVLADLAGWKPSTVTDLPTLFGSGAPGMLLTVTVVVLLAPFVEELALRGVALTAATRSWPPWAALAGTAILFAALHGNAWSFVPLTFLGLALGWVTLRYRSLWPAIALHAGYNGILVLAAFWVAGRG